MIHFHYTTWPDFGVPTSPTAFLNFLKVVREAGALEADVGPAVIHCSAGIGRSGTFCVVDSCLVLVSDELLPLDIVQIWSGKLCVHGRHKAKQKIVSLKLPKENDAICNKWF